MESNRTTILLFLVFLQLINFTVSIPSVRCAESNVLDFYIDSQTLTTTQEEEEVNCDDKHVCELKCSDFEEFKNCKSEPFLDLTKMLKKNQNYQNAYDSGCTGIINGDYLSDKTSIYFRQLIGHITKFSQEKFYSEIYKSVFPLTKKYPKLYNWSIEKIKELPEIKKNVVFLQRMLMFEYYYINYVAKRHGFYFKSTILGMYELVRGLMGLKKLCSKGYKNLKDKSLDNVVKMIHKKVYQEDLGASTSLHNKPNSPKYSPGHNVANSSNFAFG